MAGGTGGKAEGAGTSFALASTTDEACAGAGAGDTSVGGAPASTNGSSVCCWKGEVLGAAGAHPASNKMVTKSIAPHKGIDFIFQPLFDYAVHFIDSKSLKYIKINYCPKSPHSISAHRNCFLPDCRLLSLVLKGEEPWFVPMFGLFSFQCHSL